MLRCCQRASLLALWLALLPPGGAGDDQAAATATAAAAAAAAAARASPASPSPRVIVFVLGDDIGYGSAGWAAGSSARTAGPGGASLTPRLDALAADGAVLDAAVSAFWCTPARSSLLTGRLPVHVQMGQDFPETPSAGIPRNMTTWANRLTEAGWSSHVVGKWVRWEPCSVPHSANSSPTTHRRLLYSLPHHRIAPGQCRPFAAPPVRPQDAGMATPSHTPEGRGFTGSSLVYFEHMNEAWTQRVFAGGTSCTLYGPDGYFISDMWDSGAPSRTLNGSAFIEAVHADRIASILAAASPLSGGAPLLLLYTPHIAHYPLQVPREWLERYAFMGDDEGSCNATVPYIYPGSSPASQPFVCRQQGAALVGMLDEIVGNLTDAIKARGWWNETLFVFSSDNGAPLDVQEAGGGNSPLRGGKYSSWSGGISVPAFVSGGFLPAAARGSRVAGLAHIADWHATLLGIAGLDAAVPDERAAAAGLPPVDSLDLWPMISGANATSPRVEVPVAPSTLISWPFKMLKGLQWWSGFGGAVYPNASSPAASPNEWVDCKAGCLFNISADPSELLDVSAQHPGVVAAMSARIDELARAFFSNNDTGVDECPPGTLLCGCWAAVNKWGGALGPYQL